MQKTFSYDRKKSAKNLDTVRCTASEKTMLYYSLLVSHNAKAEALCRRPIYNNGEWVYWMVFLNFYSPLVVKRTVFIYEEKEEAGIKYKKNRFRSKELGAKINAPKILHLINTGNRHQPKNSSRHAAQEKEFTQTYRHRHGAYSQTAIIVINTKFILFFGAIKNIDLQSKSPTVLHTKKWCT